MGKAKNGTRYPEELRTRAVRMVLDHESEYASRSAAILSISQKVGCSRQQIAAYVRVRISGGSSAWISVWYPDSHRRRAQTSGYQKIAALELRRTSLNDAPLALILGGITRSR